MTDPLHERAQRAGAAVHERTAGMGSAGGLDAVVRRSRRPRPAMALAVLLVVVLAVPGVAWLRGLSDTRIDLAPADEPGAGVGEDEQRPDAESDPVDDPDAAQPGAPEPGDQPAVPGGAAETPLGRFGTEPVTAGDFPFGGGEVALLTAVRLAGHDGFDRVVLEFDGPDMPSYQVRLVEPPIHQDGSGEEIAVQGEAFLELVLTPASGVDLSGPEFVLTYTGPHRVTGATGVVTEVVRTGDFEATLGWVVGLLSRQPFAVSVLPDPWRLVVEVATG